MSERLTVEQVRARYRSRVDWRMRIVDALKAHGPLTTRGVYFDALNGSLNYGEVRGILEDLMTEGVVVAESTETGRVGRPGVIWSIAP